MKYIIFSVVLAWSFQARAYKFVDLPTKIDLILRCDKSVGEIAVVLKKMRDECEAFSSTDTLDKDCVSGKTFTASFNSWMCRGIDLKAAPQSADQCQKTMKLSSAVGNPVVCVQPMGVSYDLVLKLGPRTQQQIAAFKREVTESFESLGCQVTGKPSLVIAKFYNQGENQFGYYFPSKNCFLASPDAKPNCPSSYEAIRMYPLLDAKDARSSRFVCRLKAVLSPRAAKTQK